MLVGLRHCAAAQASDGERELSDWVGKETCLAMLSITLGSSIFLVIASLL